jgi:hypothetical protein
MVTIRPFANGATVSVPAVLANGVTGTLTVNGAPASVQTHVPGQNAYLTFNGTQGQSLMLALSQLALTPSSVDSASVSVTNPDGTAYTSGTCYTSSSPGCSLSLSSLPQTGVYTVVVGPDGQASFGASLSLPADVTGTLTLNEASTVNLTSLGQGAAMTFVATANESVILSVGSLTTTPADTPVTFYVYNSSGALVDQISLTAAGTLNIGTLAAGTYSVLVAPNNAATGSMSVEMESNQTTVVPTDGTLTNLATSSPGEEVYATFQGTAGENLSVTISNIALTPASSANVTWSIQAPNGASVMSSTSCSPTGPGCSVGIISIPQTGTYTISVIPQGQQTMSLLTNVSQSLGSAVSSPTNETVNLSLLGQAAALPFTYIAGENLIIDVSGLTVSPVNTSYWMGIYTPSGGYETGVSMVTGGQLKVSGLAAGNYVLWIGPDSPATGTFQLVFQQDLSTSLPTDGSLNNIATTAPGESANVTFQATAGQSVAVTLSNLSLSPASTASTNWAVTAPGGTVVLGTLGCQVGSLSQCTGGILSIPTTGTYTININPPNQQTMNVGVTIAQDMTGTISSGTNQGLDLSQLGELARLSFTVVAGQPLSSATLSGVSTSPANTTIWMGVYTQGGSFVTGAGTTSGETVSLSGLAAGSYYLWIGPETAATSSMQLSFQ